MNSILLGGIMLTVLKKHQTEKNKLHDSQRFSFEFVGNETSGEHLFELELAPDLCGKLEYRIRVYPLHPLLTHPLEMGMMVWL